MGSRAKKYFERAAAIGGLRAKIRLASLAHITSTEAESLFETSDVIAKLERAMAAVEQEFSHASGGSTASAPKAYHPVLAIRADEGAAPLLRRHISTFLELMSQRSVFFGDVMTTFRRITEASATTLEVARAGVWRVDKAVTKIVCVDVFERAKGAHFEGDELGGDEYAAYFNALREERTIAAHDAHTDPRTSCFSIPYFKPQGINSTLDVPIWVNHEMIAVLCHEHVGPRRTWNSDEENFAYMMANFASLAMERRASPSGPVDLASLRASL